MNDILNRADPKVYKRLMAGPFGHMTLEQRTALIQEVEQSEKDAKRAMERFEYGSSFADEFGHGIERKIQGIVDTVDYVWTNPKGAGEALLQGIKDELVDQVKHPFKTMSMVTNPILYSMINQLPKPETVKDFMEAGPGKKGDYIGPLFVDLVLAAAAARIKVKDLPGSKENPKIRDGDSTGAEQDVKEKEKKEQATTGAEGTGQGLKVPQGLTQAQFDKVSSMIREEVGHISDDIVVQGSRARGTAKLTSDIDIAIRVPSEKFDELIQSSFSKVKPPNPGSAKEKTMLHAIETGKIQSGEAKLSKFREQLQQELGMDVDISIIKIGGPFDNPPFTPLK